MLFLVVAIFYVILGVVLTNPGNDVLGVEGDRLTKVIHFGGQFGLKKTHGFVQEILTNGVGNLAQQAGKVTRCGQAGLGIETPRGVE